jgi:hypothetical protein
MLGKDNVQAHNMSIREQIGFMIDELTTTPERQQKTLDTLAGLNDQQLVYLLNYFDDRRPIADRDVKFLNEYKYAFEKYFMTSADTVGEVVIQFVCSRVESCVPGRNLADVQKIKRQLLKQFRICRAPDGWKVPCREKPAGLNS